MPIDFLLIIILSFLLFSSLEMLFVSPLLSDESLQGAGRDSIVPASKSLRSPAFPSILIKRHVRTYTIQVSF